MDDMKVRPHRDFLADSMKEVETIPNTKEALAEWVCRKFPSTYTTEENITLEKGGYDDRIEWDTYYILNDGSAIGMADGPLD